MTITFAQHKTGVARTIGLMLACSTTTFAQHQHSPHGAAAPSERANQQIRDVETSVSRFASPEAARTAGFQSALGWIPSMGTHWVNRQRMRDGFDVREPDHLLFSPVNGKQQLVGVAYAFRGAPGTDMPDGFDGALDQWHDHPALAPGDETLHMLHVWFVPSPDGVFAGHNPWLAFWAVGLTPPDIGRMQDSASASRIRALSAALAATVEPMPLDRLLSRFASSRAEEEVKRRRAAIRTLIPQLERAQASGDLATWDRLAGAAAGHWRDIRRVYVDSAPSPRARALVMRLLDQVIGSDGAGNH